MKHVSRPVSHGLRRPLTTGAVRELPTPGSSRYLHAALQNTKETKQVEVDEVGIPLKPTWSVRSLLASYPSPSVNDDTLDRLHRLAALQAPEKDSKEREALKEEMEGLVRLVGAVRIAELDGKKSSEHPGLVDGRVYPLPQTVSLEPNAEVADAGVHFMENGEESPNGRELLKHSQTATQTSYVLPDLSAR